ncbi:uncharacterized protein LOC129288347 [Prosopis cineraria]|uniref:uncharacterized protein LOC129288347 n=1 Tax=Prosopis cineraria TaxID=364024 RepID=UPI00240E9CB7|nr:uncharacterized protein LOC129288347 [Prosopis cineraria]
MATKMNHPYHPQHAIVLKREGGPFNCSGCKEPGFGPRYHCCKRNCHFVLHDHCATARPTDRPRIHPLMGNRQFEFLWEPPGGPKHRYCDACGRDVQGFLYHDQSRRGFDLHPCCMNLKRTMSDPQGKIKLSLKDKVHQRCKKCKRKDLDNVRSEEPFRGWSYVSSCGKHTFHVYCAKTLIMDNWESGYFNVKQNRSSITSATSSSSSLVSRSGTTNSKRSKSVQRDRNLITSATGSSSAVDRRRSSRARPFLTLGIQMAKIGFSVITSVIFGNPIPFIATLIENLAN